MFRRDERPEQILAHYFAIAAAEDEPRPTLRAAHAAPDARQLVPGHVRMSVMRNVQIVVQEDQRPESIRFNDVRARGRMIIGTVLGERAYVSEGYARIHDEQ